MCFKPYPTLGQKSLAQVLPFGIKEQQMIEEAAGRLAAGVDPGVIPERFMIGAARFALDNKLARPGMITENFYKELARR
jgi:transketolase C-terminal domain/subunit